MDIDRTTDRLRRRPKAVKQKLHTQTIDIDTDRMTNRYRHRHTHGHRQNDRQTVEETKGSRQPSRRSLSIGMPNQQPPPHILRGTEFQTVFVRV